MILVAPDKFKGTFTADEICQLVTRRLRNAGYNGTICCRPVSDGGEGIASTIMPDAVKISKGAYALSPSAQLIVSAELVGLSEFEGKNIPLMNRSSFALGNAVNPDVHNIIAVGGTAVSDGGAGFMQALGVKFYDASGCIITTPLTPASINNIHSADTSSLRTFSLEGIIDVHASLTGPGLSALDFARQKALPDESLEQLPDALNHLQQILGGNSMWDGAGGGIGYALASVCGAPCRSGADAAVNSLSIDWSDVELVITGEGCVDVQTTKGGKLVDAIYKKASSLGIPVLILYGKCDAPTLYPNMVQLNSPWENLCLNSHISGCDGI